MESEVQLSARRAADLQPGMVMGASIVELSDGSSFVTDWGYVYPSFYAAVADHKEEFGSTQPPGCLFRCPPDGPRNRMRVAQLGRAASICAADGCAMVGWMGKWKTTGSCMCI